MQERRSTLLISISNVPVVPDLVYKVYRGPLCRYSNFIRSTVLLVLVIYGPGDPATRVCALSHSESLAVLVLVSLHYNYGHVLKSSHFNSNILWTAIYTQEHVSIYSVYDIVKLCISFKHRTQQRTPDEIVH
jgi:hypothetical protein